MARIVGAKHCAAVKSRRDVANPTVRQDFSLITKAAFFSREPSMGFVSWLKSLVGIVPKHVSHRPFRTKVQADREERIEIGDKQIDPIKLRRDKRPRNRFKK